jgi:tetratricopeptide (TPR) repeat protein
MKQTIIITFLTSFCFLQISAQDKYLEEGNMYLSDKEFDKAEKVFRKGIKSDSSNLVYQCQLGLTLIQKEKYSEAQFVLDRVLSNDSNNVGAIWYSGIGNFKNGNDRKAISYFEKALKKVDKESGQYYSANWYIGKSYSILLQTEGISYSEADRMFECYEEYLRLQPNANDAATIREYVDRKRARRPPSNVLKWVDL